MDSNTVYCVSSEGQNLVLFYTGFSPYSNFNPTGFNFNGRYYNCNEQWYQSEKAAYFKDWKIHQAIMQYKSPRTHKKLGAKVAGFNGEEWLKVRDDVMVVGLRAKVHQNPNIMKELQATGDAIIAEASPYDEYWGTGCGLKDDMVVSVNAWKGKNILGKLWMKVRDELKQSETITIS